MPQPYYAFPVRLLLEVFNDALRDKPRSFREDALRCVQALSPPLEVRGGEHIPVCAPFLLTVNHYSRPGFNAGWIALAASAAVPVELHWITTAAWTFPGRRLARPLRKASEIAFRQLAITYGFTSMPPMPPAPGEEQARAEAVRRVLDYARRTPEPAIGLAPEGQDHPGGVLCSPPPGAGRFVSLLAEHCRRIVPAGVYEEGGRLVVQFGVPYKPELPSGSDRGEQDRHTSHSVMAAIAAEMPPRLRGEYA